MTDDALSRLFEPFYLPEFARGRSTGGSGLGLAITITITITITKRCIKACRGTLTAENRPKGGLELRIHLPSQ